MNAERKSYDKKVRAELRQAKTRLEELEAHSRAEDEEVIVDLIHQLKSRHQKLEKRRERVLTAAVEETNQEMTAIDAGIAELRAGLVELDKRLRSKAA